MGGDSDGLSDIKSSGPPGHLRVAAIITPPRSGRNRNTEALICNISKLSCASLWLESGELDFSNLWERPSFLHTLPSKPTAGNWERCKPKRDTPSETELDNGTSQQHKAFLFARLTLQTVTCNTLGISDQTISDPQISSVFSNPYFLIMWKRPVTAEGKLLKTCVHVREIN